jgi:hypothetical protein
MAVGSRSASVKFVHKSEATTKDTKKRQSKDKAILKDDTLVLDFRVVAKIDEQD